MTGDVSQTNQVRSKPYPKGLRLGAGTSVIVFPTDNGFLNALGRFRIRLSSYWNYVS